MDERLATPRRRSLWIVAIAAPLAIAFVLAGGLAARSMASDPVRHGRDAQATILSRNGERALVRFPAANGALTTTWVAICHHQSYAVGNMLLVRYDARVPAHAAERDMLPGPHLALPALVMLFGVVGTLMLSFSCGRRAFPRSATSIAPAWDGLPGGSPWAQSDHPQLADEEFAVVDAPV